MTKQCMYLLKTLEGKPIHWSHCITLQNLMLNWIERHQQSLFLDGIKINDDSARVSIVGFDRLDTEMAITSRSPDGIKKNFSFHGRIFLAVGRGAD